MPPDPLKACVPVILGMDDSLARPSPGCFCQPWHFNAMCYRSLVASYIVWGSHPFPIRERVWSPQHPKFVACYRKQVTPIGLYYSYFMMFVLELLWVLWNYARVTRPFLLWERGSHARLLVIKGRMSFRIACSRNECTIFELLSEGLSDWKDSNSLSTLEDSCVITKF